MKNEKIIQFHSLCQKQNAKNDKSLKDYFVVTSTIKDLLGSENKSILLKGLKGIGKTATFRYLTEQETTPSIIIPISLANYNCFLKSSDINSKAACEQFKQDIAIECLRVFYEQNKKDKKNDLVIEAKKHFSKYKEALEKYAGHFGGISVLGCGFTINQGSSPVLVGLQDKKDSDEVIQLLDKIGKSGISFRIVIDDPEEIFSATRFIDTHLLGGLCLAAIDMNEEFSNLRVIVILKSHVFDPIYRDVEDLHIPPSYIISKLSWSKTELKQLIVDRLKHVGLTLKELFKNVPEVDIEESFNNQLHFLRTGPRDLLKIYDWALIESNDEPLTLENINNAINKMAVDNFKEVRATNSSEYPKIDELLKEIFFSFRTPKKLKEFPGLLTELKVKNEDLRAIWKTPWLQMETQKTISRVFFNIGVVLLVVNSKTILPYEPEYEIDNFEIADKLDLVPILRKAK